MRVFSDCERLDSFVYSLEFTRMRDDLIQTYKILISWVDVGMVTLMGESQARGNKQLVV